MLITAIESVVAYERVSRAGQWYSPGIEFKNHSLIAMLLIINSPYVLLLFAEDWPFQLPVLEQDITEGRYMNNNISNNDNNNNALGVRSHYHNAITKIHSKIITAIIILLVIKLNTINEHYYYMK